MRKNGQKSFVHVRYSSELFEQVSWEESEYGVFGGDHLVRLVDVLFLDATLMVVIVLWELLVDEDGARRAGDL